LNIVTGGGETAVAIPSSLSWFRVDAHRSNAHNRSPVSRGTTFFTGSRERLGFPRQPAKANGATTDTRPHQFPDFGRKITIE
jgi:hypothetical protein